MKKIISWMLAWIMIITLLPISAFAAKGDKLIALTFDDGPHYKYTDQLLDGLEERGVNVTFFVLGEKISSNLDLIKRAYDHGHEIASHTYSHLNLNNQSTSTIRSEISKTAAGLDKACGSGTDYLVRPPYGNANSTVLSVLNAPAILWNVDTNDWKYKNSDHVYNHIIDHASNGAIILCHDIHSTTIPGALRAIDTLLARGYEFVTVSELYRRRGVSLDDGVKYYNCRNTGVDEGAAETPVITYEPENDGVRIHIESPSGAPVYYVLDDSRITQDSARYTGSFVTTCPVEVHAVAAFDLNGDRSETASLKLTLLPCAKPEIWLDGDKAVISCATDGVSIHYTTDGSVPTISSPRYAGAFTVQPGTTIRAVAGGGKHMISEETALHYSKNCNLFADVFPGEWYYDAIDILAAMGMMSGVGKNVYAPNGATSRAMLVTLLYRCSGEVLEKDWIRTNPFADVEDDAWYSEAIEWAYRNKVVNGYPDNTFRHSQSITRQEMAQMFANYLAWDGYELDRDVDCRSKFQDGGQIAGWALGSVNAVTARGLMVGDTGGFFHPEQTATRAETGTVLLRIILAED